MSTPDITKAISSNDIKNGASLLLLNKAGIKVVFDSSRDTEQGLDPLGTKTTDRFDDTEYYSPPGSSGGGNSFGIPSNTGLVPNSTSINNIVSISQTNYNALATKDPNTLYIIN